MSELLAVRIVEVITGLRSVRRKILGGYVAPSFGCADFDQSSSSITVPDSEITTFDQMNYAHIIVEQGTDTCRDVEHKFNVWADSMQINWRIFAKEISPMDFRARFPNAKSIEELAHFGKLFMRTIPG
jgi:hypothetical protein